MDNNYVINVEDLSVSYGHKRVLSNIFLNVVPGHIYGVLGPNGAGKSTLFKSVLGLIEDYMGDITIFGKDIEEVRTRISYVPQRDDVDWSFPAQVRDIVMMGRYPHKGLFEKLDENDDKIANDAMEQLGISDLAYRQIGMLSGGQQQRVFIARALAQQPDIYLLDEPFVGIDIKTEEIIIDILKKLASQGKSLLVVHHDLNKVQDFFSKVILLNQRLIAYGDTEQVFTEDNVAKAYGAQLNILHKTRL